MWAMNMKSTGHTIPMTFYPTAKSFLLPGQLRPRKPTLLEFLHEVIGHGNTIVRRITDDFSGVDRILTEQCITKIVKNKR